jgi:hypothetical protein
MDFFHFSGLYLGVLPICRYILLSTFLVDDSMVFFHFAYLSVFRGGVQIVGHETNPIFVVAELMWVPFGWSVFFRIENAVFCLA